MKIVDIIYWLLNAFLLYSIIQSFILRRKTKKIIDGINKRYEDFITTHNERANTLSRENAKVIEQNEMLKERLRNMGIKDFDVI